MPARGGAAGAWGWGLLLGLILSLGVQTQSADAEGASVEYKVKAAWLYNFTLFVNWPSNAFPNPEAPFRIAVIGDDPFGPLLDQALEGKDFGGRKIAVQRATSASLPQGLHLVFIARSERARLPAILAQLRDSRALLVSDIEDFAAQGGIIGMDKQGTRLHLSINLRNAEQAGLEIKARMLSLKNVRLLGRPVGGAPS